jgi:hypothetical protein
MMIAVKNTQNKQITTWQVFMLVTGSSVYREFNIADKSVPVKYGACVAH